MNKFRLTINVLALVIFTFAFASMAQAQATRTWVSGVGDDVNPCSRTAPCKTFAGAISKTQIAGEIDALDDGGFGAVTVTKSITIEGGGHIASVLASGTTGINVNITTTTTADPKQSVILRRLTITGTGTSTCSGVTCGLPTGIRGINFTAGKQLSVESCYISAFTNEGIRILQTAQSQTFITDTVVENCGANGLSASTTSGQAWVAVRNSSFLTSGVGLRGLNNARIYIDSSTFSNNIGQGVFSDGTSGAAVVDVANSSIFNNGTAGVQAQTGGTIARISNCDIHNNQGTGALVSAGGEIDTFQNNRIFNNGTDGCTSCTPKGVN